MSDQELNNFPTVVECLKAAAPGAPASEKQSMIQRLKDGTPVNDDEKGLKLFMEHHHYDFDALFEFLNQATYQKPGAKKTGFIRHIKPLMAAAAAIVIIVMVVSRQYESNATLSIIKQAACYEPGLPVFASFQQNRDFHEMMSAFRRKESAHGISFYHKLTENGASSDTIHYFGGYLFYQSKQYDLAAKCFKQCLQATNSTYTDKATYMYALSEYLSDNKPVALEWLKNISADRSSAYAKDAQKLITDKRLWNFNLLLNRTPQ